MRSSPSFSLSMAAVSSIPVLLPQKTIAGIFTPRGGGTHAKSADRAEVLFFSIVNMSIIRLKISGVLTLTHTLETFHYIP